MAVAPCSSIADSSSACSAAISPGSPSLCLRTCSRGGHAWGVTWGSVTWGSVTWGSVTWGSVTWGSSGAIWDRMGSRGTTWGQIGPVTWGHVGPVTWGHVAARPACR
eukprot:5417983-Prymnesium_polylepis.1